ncbi:uncharacterized protein LOC127010888 [Drosophila biarmipes]|uniref:uncharacterized protein LOC127010888 n=1 Tax=Drosophila biarmipes TaxID=125945 RepID=UPI0021CD0891|nr:uncharacterized protein LOC127010888 [Drosophila biarmipes]
MLIHISADSPSFAPFKSADKFMSPITIQSLKSSAHFEIALQCPEPSPSGRIVVSSLVPRPAIPWLTPAVFSTTWQAIQWVRLFLDLLLAVFVHPHSGASTGGHGKSIRLWIAGTSGLVMDAIALASSAI